jgi:ankyrin repeat protein
MSDVQLIDAVKAGNSSNVEELLDAGADVNQQDEQGWTPLNWAAGRGDLAVVRSLVERGADVFKVGRDQRTPYKIALAAGHAEVVRFLQEAEAKAGGGREEESPRQHAKAYVLADLRKFGGWREERINWKESDNADRNGGGDRLSDDDVVFLHQDLTVSRSIWRDENVIFNQVTPEWRDFCENVLQFKVPSDLDLIVSARSEESGNFA